MSNVAKLNNFRKQSATPRTLEFLQNTKLISLGNKWLGKEWRGRGIIDKNTASEPMYEPFYILGQKKPV